MGHRWGWCYTLGVAIGFSAIEAIATSFFELAIAQITPDNTLGNEQSHVTSNDKIRGLPAILIQGGAVRGSSLFQSFSDFNVADGQRVYFANPAGVQTILSRITGQNLSRILGTLGVDGTASLFLLNPNGIFFGPNARLDIAGSFVASTADHIPFENGVQFSATAPNPAPLLTINLRPRRYGAEPRGDIHNAGDLAVGVGQTLSLLGNTVINTGSLTASGGIVEVLGDRVALLDAARIDTSGIAGGTVLIGGDVQGRGPALNATQTVVGSGVAIAADGVGPVATGGQVVVWSNNSTRFSGSVSARGGTAGQGGFVEISGSQLSFAGTVDVMAPAGRLGTVLFDPQDITVVPGRGTNDSSLSDGAIFKAEGGAANFTIGSDTLAAIPGDIILQATRNITVDAPIALTTPAASLRAESGNNITVNQNITTVGGDVGLYANNGVLLNNAIIQTSNPGGVAGTVELSGRLQVSLVNSQILARSDSSNGLEFNGIGLVSNQGSVSISGSTLSATNFGTGFAGDVVVTARKDVTVTNGSLFSRGKVGRVYIGQADYPGYEFSPRTIRLSNATIETSNDAVPAGTSADAGQIFIQATDAVAIDNGSTLQSDAAANVQGTAGGIGITAESLTINDSNLSTSVFATNSVAGSFSSIPDRSQSTTAGAIVFLVEDNITLSNSNIFNNLENGASGQAGVVLILADSLNLFNGSQIQTLVRGDEVGQPPAQGTAGNILIGVNKTIRVRGSNRAGFISQITSTVGSGATSSTAGTIILAANSVQVRDGGRINVSNDGEGQAGDIFISARAIWLDNQSRIDAVSQTGQGGSIFLDVPGAVILGRNSIISTSTVFANPGDQAGNIAIGSGNLLRLASLSGRVAPTFEDRILLIAGKTPRDSNIFSVGFFSAGGNIRINAFNLQDIAQRPASLRTNDITSQSLFDIDGETVIDTLNIEPSQRPAALQDTIREPQIADGCDPRDRSEPSRFTVVGRGGTQATASEQPGARPLSGSWVRVPEEDRSTAAPGSTVSQTPSRAEPPAAQGWTIAPDGEILLTANATYPIAHSPRASLTCYAP
ncbi:MAG: filamentous hemagglutinin N-terminal domain-containing protein [Lyngbya sp. HA4199-MV5]|jgi:filamentous hemagglutinin family protein|nr:filamentous hemagglutinin N-terminal domain-containing protein [Lyngbya sp. HA4199-MV5]